MLIEITDTNKPYFITVAPDMILSLISLPHIHALGDYEKDEDEKIVVRGIIVFSLVRKKPTIIWHFVDEAYRCLGVGDALLSEVIEKYSSPVSLLFFSRYVSADYFKDIKGYYEDFGFRVDEALSRAIPDFLFVTKNINEYPALKMASIDEVHPLSDFSKIEVNSAITSLLPEGLMSVVPIGTGQLDKEISCVTNTNGIITSALLVGDYDSGITIFAIGNLASDSPANILKLLHYFILKVNERYPQGCRVNIISSQSKERQADAFRYLFSDANEYESYLMTL